MFRERTYDITLVGESGPEQLARHQNREGFGNFATEHDFSSSPTGDHLIYARDEGIVLRDRTGKERFIEGVRGGKFRFSSDGTRLAYAVDDYEEQSSSLQVLDLQSHRVSKLGVLPMLDHLRWTRGGVLADHTTRSGQVRLQQLDHVSLSGKRSTVFSNRLLSYEGSYWEHFVAHDQEDRIVIFHGGEIIEIRPDEERWHSQKVGTYRGYVRNAEMSRQGELAFVTKEAVFLMRRGEKKAKKLARSRAVHSLWFSRDGQRLGYANKSQVSVQDLSRGQAKRWSPRGKKLSSLRFLADSSGVILTANQKVYLWPNADLRPTLAASVSIHDLGGADVFADAIVLWTSYLEPRPTATLD